ncbi:Eukaryotic translation initiation factor 4E-binding protein 3 [Camelus dromedarius]|uniref:Eukaryotic translation initiation factor 4E-binding protein 3 n=1 Tax=Camelus dromedarius TaxID=9838 RepID=A0A5N4ECY5_CAMDR|nr:Eukaryotic translation initiation factor 4E-binding protein 3 [Camelus dromedarius]
MLEANRMVHVAEASLLPSVPALKGEISSPQLTRPKKRVGQPMVASPNQSTSTNLLSSAPPVRYVHIHELPDSRGQGPATRLLQHHAGGHALRHYPGSPYPLTGTRIIYDRKFLLECKNSPIARTPPCCLPQIPGVTTPPTAPPSKLEELKEQKETEEEIPDDAQFEMDI